jgi:hypothetical protein
MQNFGAMYVVDKNEIIQLSLTLPLSKILRTLAPQANRNKSDALDT